MLDTMTYTKNLCAADRDALTAHLLALSEDDHAKSVPFASVTDRL